MAAPNVEVVELAPRETMWAREFRLSRPNNDPVLVEDLLALRGALDPDLVTQLPFWAKLSFNMTLVAHNPWEDEGVEDVLQAYGGYDLLQPAPWKVSPNADPDWRVGGRWPGRSWKTTWRERGSGGQETSSVTSTRFTSS